MPVLYDAVALGMWAYTRSAFRVQTLGVEHLRLEPGTILVSCHRRETDVPLFCPSAYFQGGLWADRSRRLAFLAREDMLAPGFFAGFPPGLSPGLRRLLYPIDAGGVLRRIQVHPIGSASSARLDEALRARPELRLVELVPDAVKERIAARAAELGLPQPVYAGDALRGEYADLLWTSYGRADLPSPELERLWSRRAARAAAQFRDLVELVRRGAVILVFPEGRPSPDGAIGPLRRGLSALVRRGRPRWLLPVGIAYDPLVQGRTRAFVAFGERVEAPESGVDELVLALLRRTLPLTAGQLVASGRVDLGDVDAAVREAQAEGRALDRGLADPERRRGRLDEAAAAAAAARADTLAYLAREYASARASIPS